MVRLFCAVWCFVGHTALRFATRAAACEGAKLLLAQAVELAAPIQSVGSRHCQNLLARQHRWPQPHIFGW